METITLAGFLGPGDLKDTVKIKPLIKNLSFHCNAIMGVKYNQLQVFHGVLLVNNNFTVVLFLHSLVHLISRGHIFGYRSLASLQH